MGGGTKDDRGLLSLVPRRRVADVSLASSTLSQRAVSTKHIESNKTSKQSSKETYGLPPRIPAKVENYLPKAYRSDYRGANESPNKRRKMAAGIFPDRPDKPNEMYASPSLSRSFQRLRHRQHRNTPERNATISRENSPQVISRQRTPSLTTQFQQQHFGRRQSGPASPVMSLPTSHSNKLPAVPALARPGEWQSFEDRLDNVEVPSERIKGICVSYTISEDMSGDGGNRILSRIGEKMRDSCEGKLRVRGSYIDRWSLKHEREAVGDDNGLQYHTQPQQQRPSHRPLPFGQSPSRTGSRLATGGLEDLKGSRARSSSNDYNRPKKGKPAEFERIVYCVGDPTSPKERTPHTNGICSASAMNQVIRISLRAVFVMMVTNFAVNVKSNLSKFTLMDHGLQTKGYSRVLRLRLSLRLRLRYFFASIALLNVNDMNERKKRLLNCKQREEPRLKDDACFSVHP
jgi:hypothetical protein